KTHAPAPASASESARPMWPAAPVTRATLPSSENAPCMPSAIMSVSAIIERPAARVQKLEARLRKRGPDARALRLVERRAREAPRRVTELVGALHAQHDGVDPRLPAHEREREIDPVLAPELRH